MASRLVRRFGGWVTALAVTCAVVAGIRFMVWVQPLAGKLPPMVFGAWGPPGPDTVDYVTLTTGTLLSGGIVFLVLFAANALLWARRGEV